jgi:hypothetical protein
MINGLGVTGWGVGGIEAEAVMLGQTISMVLPEVVGFKLTGDLTQGTTATDLVLTCVEMLRKRGVVGKFVEFYGHIGAFEEDADFEALMRSLWKSSAQNTGGGAARGQVGGDQQACGRIT